MKELYDGSISSSVRFPTQAKSSAAAMPILTVEASMMRCAQCQDCGWVCEEHPGRPWAAPRACGCGAAGLPCPICNIPEDGEEPNFHREIGISATLGFT